QSPQRSADRPQSTQSTQRNTLGGIVGRTNRRTNSRAARFGADSSSPNRSHGSAHAFFQRRDAVPELADGDAAVERPVVAEDVDRAACDQRRAAEQRGACFLKRANRRRRRERNPPPLPPAGQP